MILLSPNPELDETLGQDPIGPCLNTKRRQGKCRRRQTLWTSADFHTAENIEKVSAAELRPSGRVVAYRASTPGPGSIPGLSKVDSAFHPFSGSIKYKACLETKTLKVSLQSDHLIGTSAHALSAQWSRILGWAQ
ncbi:hypothetical protein TNCV_5010441 [Trichonephila clavipes]|nr:hypothetical protein TNCV_5010441 [Trichonephila clavipes]